MKHSVTPFFLAAAFSLSGAECLRAALVMDFVTVGDVGNAADSTGFGAVNYAYKIGKYEVTIGQYTAFLNAVASTDSYELYNAAMATDLNIAGISRSGSSGSYSYSVINNSGSSANRPITYVSWFDAARFVNWLENGQPTGSQGISTTENGAYTLDGVNSGIIAKNAINPNTGQALTYWIPSEDEWYKGAYYKGGGTNAGYWLYPTQSNSAPGNSIGNSANSANYFKMGIGANGYSLTNSQEYFATQTYLSNVGGGSAVAQVHTEHSTRRVVSGNGMV